MIKDRKNTPAIGCLVIEDLSSGGQYLSGLSAFLEKMGINTEVFKWDGRGDVHICLQNAFHHVWSQCDKAFITACGTGIAGAVALGVQLPVERMVFIDKFKEKKNERPDIRRQISRLYRFSRRNAAFCISDILLVSSCAEVRKSGMRGMLRQLVNCRIDAADIYDHMKDKMCTNGEHLPEMPIYRFFTAGECSKSLAENSEMCIIYE